MLGGQVLPLCARCTGIYSGIFFAMAFFFLTNRQNNSRPYTMWGILFAAFSFLPVSLDGFFSYLGLWESNNFLRVVTGVIGGASLPGLFLLGANFDPKGANGEPIFQNIGEQILLTLGSLLWGLLLWKGVGFYGFSALIMSGGVVFFWAGLGYLVLRNLLVRKKFPFWTCSFVMSGLFIFVIGMVIK